jgi:hypothetical protein
MQIAATAQWLCPADRDLFWQAVADELIQQPACAERAIAIAFATYWQQQPAEAP